MEKKFKAFMFATVLLVSVPVHALNAPKIKIWKDVPSMKKQTYSTLYAYPAPEGNNSGAAVVICPGGSYHHLGIFHEGKDVALWFQSQGVNAFVLKYRVSGKGYHHPAMLEDIQRSLQLIRENADEYGINTEKVGAIGFSAGGHLVLMAGAFHEKMNELEKLGITTDVSLRPDFVIPVYPVVSMQDDIGHQWSKKSLLGKDQSQERKDLFSMELQMEEGMPPVFLLTNKDDQTVMYENSTRLAESLQKAGIPHKFILGEIGDHGFGMGNNKFVHSTQWNDNWLKPWLIETGILEK